MNTENLEYLIKERAEKRYIQEMKKLHEYLSANPIASGLEISIDGHIVPLVGSNRRGTGIINDPKFLSSKMAIATINKGSNLQTNKEAVINGFIALESKDIIDKYDEIKSSIKNEE